MKRDSTVLAVVSGKGGVGKSVITVNLAESLAADGHRVAIVDADFGQNACSVLLNETPEATVMDVLRYTAEPKDMRHATAMGITLIDVTTEPDGAFSREQELYSRLDDLVTDLRGDHDYVLIDAPAGLEGPVRWAVDRADLTTLVIVGEPTAIADAYRLARLIWTSDPSYPVATIVNFADSAEDASSVADRFSEITERFTGQLPNYLGWVPFSRSIRSSVMKQTPAARHEGPVRRAFEDLARTVNAGRTLLAESVDPP
ncbi:MAG: P-loop NTPase [Rhodothermales bacterium]